MLEVISVVMGKGYVLRGGSILDKDEREGTHRYEGCINSRLMI